ncbi:O-antigen ligase family protein [Streptomyces sp. NPDC092370]|uniref:O-antigen ligase family protein n=1 Tax=Streptomyces sp. NPDC092370 TaxID=3366016 RepID=UPI00380AB3FC
MDDVGGISKRMLLYLVGIGPAVNSLLVRRDASRDITAEMNPYIGWRLTVTQSLTAALVALSIITILTSWRQGFLFRKRGILLFGGLLFFSGPIISAALDGFSSPWQELLTAPLVFTAFCLGQPPPIRRTISDVRCIARVYVWGSLLSIIVAPEWAFEQLASAADLAIYRDYLGLGAGRLIGFTTHPNLLGPVAAISLALEVHPLFRRQGWAFHALAAGSVLLLAQSRTAWFCLIALLYFHRVQARQRRGAPKFTLFMTCISLLAAVLLVDKSQMLLADAMSDGEIGTLNGRTLAWEYAMAELRQNPLTGYGPTLFSIEYRMEVMRDPSLFWVGQAHNQALQTLGAYGIIGFIGLISFLSVMLVHSKRLSRETGGLLLALQVMILIRCLTESPMERLGGLSCNLMLLALNWALLLSAQEHRPPGDEELLTSAPVTSKTHSSPRRMNAAACRAPVMHSPV